MSGITSTLWITGSYVVVLLLFFALFNFMTKGFFWQYLKVKMSRGKLILVKCHDVTDSFYKAGHIDTNKNLIVKDYLKKIHTFSNIDRNYIGRELGVNLIEVELIKGVIIKKDFSGSTGYDLTMVDELVNRAIMLPTLNSDLIWEKVEKVLVVVIIIGIGIVLYLQLSTPDTIIAGVTNKIASICTSGGNI